MMITLDFKKLYSEENLQPFIPVEIGNCTDSQILYRVK